MAADIIKAHTKYLTDLFKPDDKDKISKKTWTYLKHKEKGTVGIPTLH